MVLWNGWQSELLWCQPHTGWWKYTYCILSIPSVPSDLLGFLLRSALSVCPGHHLPPLAWALWFRQLFLLLHLQTKMKNIHSWTISRCSLLPVPMHHNTLLIQVWFFNADEHAQTSKLTYSQVPMTYFTCLLWKLVFSLAVLAQCTIFLVPGCPSYNLPCTT